MDLSFLHLPLLEEPELWKGDCSPSLSPSPCLSRSINPWARHCHALRDVQLLQLNPNPVFLRIIFLYCSSLKQNDFFSLPEQPEVWGRCCEVKEIQGLCGCSLSGWMGITGMDFSFPAFCYPTLPCLQDTPGKSYHPPSFTPWGCRKRCLGATQPLCSREKRIWKQLPQVRDHWAPSDLWLINHCRVLARITGVNKEHFCVQVWISWKWDCSLKPASPCFLLSGKFRVWILEFLMGLELMNTQLP